MVERVQDPGLGVWEQPSRGHLTRQGKGEDREGFLEEVASALRSEGSWEFSGTDWRREGRQGTALQGEGFPRLSVARGQVQEDGRAREERYAGSVSVSVTNTWLCKHCGTSGL